MKNEITLSPHHDDTPCRDDGRFCIKSLLLLFIGSFFVFSTYSQQRNLLQVIPAQITTAWYTNPFGLNPDPDNTGWTKISEGTIKTASGSEVKYELTAMTAFLAEAANLDQLRNGGIGSPPTPDNWSNGNAGPENSHYIEGWSIPYRMIFTDMTPASSNTVTIEWDIMGSSGTKHALDYITHYQNLGTDALHNAIFGHNAEVVKPYIGIAGVSAGSFSTFPIPLDPQVTGGGVTQLPGNFTMWNGTITSVSAYSSTAGGFIDGAKTRITITFTPDNGTVVLAWGGHIASQVDWGVGKSASDINGSPYHTRLIELNGKGGNQDRSLKADAVVVPPECTINGPATACPTTASLQYTATLSNSAGTSTTYAWSLTGNTANATISGSASGSIAAGLTAIPAVTVIPASPAGFTAGGTFTVSLNVTRTFSGIAFSNTCSKMVTITNPSVLADVIAAEADVEDLDGIKPISPSPDCPRIYELNLLRANVVHLQATGAPAGSTYSWVQSPGSVGGNTSFSFNAATGDATFTINSIVPFPADLYTFTVTATTADGCVATSKVCIVPTAVLPTCNLCGPTSICSSDGNQTYSLKSICTNADPDALDLIDFDYVWTIKNVTGGGTATFTSTGTTTTTNTASVTVQRTGTVTGYTVQLNINGKGPLGISTPPCTITTVVNSTPAPTLGKVDPTCTVATGCVTVTSSTAGLTFSLDGGSFTAYPAGGWCSLAPGEHCVRAQNTTTNCISTPTCITIPPQPATPPAPTLGKVDPTCTVATGCVTVTSSTAGLTFSLDGGSFTAYPAGGWCSLAPGEHCVRAQNASGCISQTCITIPPQPATPPAPTLGKVDPTCTVATGCVTVTSSTAGLTFSLDGGSFTAYPAGGWCSLAPGEHCVRAQNASGCISQTCITIPPAPATPPAPTLGKVDPTCTVATGCVTVTSSTAGLTFSLDGGSFTAYPAGGWCSLAPGQHCVRAQNASGCISQTCITIPPQPATPPAPTLGKVDPTCTVATGCVTVTSSTAGLTFSLDGGSFTAYPAGGWCSLAPGEHCVRAQNASGCISQTCITIPPQPATPPAPTLGKVDPTCTVATGCVTVTSSTAGLTFSLDGGSFTAYPAGGWCSLAPGEHCVRAQNASGCISQTCITIPPAPATPPAPTLGKVDPTCTVATGCVTVTSSTVGLTFSLDGGSFTAYPAGGWCSLAPGEHCVRAQNASGCISQTCITIPPQPATPPAPTLGKVDPTCTVATGCVTVTSSTAGLTFSLDGGSFTAYPAGGWCSLAPGEHCVRAQNASGCISQTCITIPPAPATPPAPTLGKVDPTCTVATGCVTVTSSTVGLTFSLDGGSFTAYPAGGWCSLAPGEHCVRAQNASGCISQTCITIPPQPATPPAPTLGKVDPTCTVATGCVTVTSSTAGLTFSLDGGSFTAYPAGGWCSLAPGEHCVRAQNASGCISQTCITIPPQPATPPAPTLGKVDPTCTVATGCVTVTSSTAGLTFSLDGGSFTAYPAGGWCSLAPGEHCVRAQNASGCISQTCITIPPAPATPPAPTLGKVDPTCTVATGCVTVTSSTAGLTFSLDGGSFTAYPAGGWCSLAPGEHCVRAQNTSGCISQTCITIPPQPATPPAPILGKVDPTCTVATGCVTVTSSTVGLTFSLDGGSFTAYPAGGWCSLAPGQHCVRAQNASGCISQTCIIIPDVPLCTQAFCTYTQGYYGNDNGKSCDGTTGGNSTAELITHALNSYPGSTMIIGNASSYVTIGLGDVSKVIEYLPGGGNSYEYKHAGSMSISSLPPTNPNFKNMYTKMTGNGNNAKFSINNTLLAQTITLGLNLGIKSNLGDLVLQGGVIATAAPLGGCGSNDPVERKCIYDPVTHALIGVENEYSYTPISASVVNALDADPTKRTVQKLFALANRALGNSDGIDGSEDGISLSAIASAVDAINNAYDGCRIHIGFNVAPCSSTDPSIPTITFTSNNDNILSKVNDGQLTVSASPNPFTDKVRFVIESTVSGNGSLEIFDMVGRKVQTVFQGYVQAGRGQVVDYNVSGEKRQNLIFMMKVGNKQVTGKLLNIK